MTNNNTLKNFRDAIEEFVKLSLIPSSPFYLTPTKIINDSIWGNVTFFEWEIKILDLLLLQRLRYISQTGTAYLVYPTATHTRFDHTVGTIGILHKVIKMMNSQSEPPGIKEREGEPEKISERIYYVLRLAALLHDVGHAFFSHVSERAFSDTKKFRDDWGNIRDSLERQYFEKESGLLRDHKFENSNFLNNEIGLSLKNIGNKTRFKKDIKDHEIVSALIVESKAFRKFFEKEIYKDELFDFGFGTNIGDTEKKCVILLSIISKCILGLSPILFDLVSNKATVLSYMAELINGPMDVDKLDYLARDSHIAGLTITYDIERFLNKILLEKDIPETNIEHKFLVLEENASHVFEQIIINKMMLYSYIYHHQKVLTADTLVQKICKMLTFSTLRIKGCKKYSIFKRITDFFSWTEMDFLTKKGGLMVQIDSHISLIDKNETLSTEDSKRLKRFLLLVKEFIDSLIQRNLDKRSIVIFPRYITRIDGSRNLLDEIEKIFGKEFSHSVAKMIRKFLNWFDNNRKNVNIDFVNFEGTHVTKDDLKGIFSIINEKKYTDNVEFLFDVIIPKVPEGNEALSIMYKTKGGPLVSSRDVFPLAKWVKAYENHKWAIYIMTRKELRIIVNIISRYHLLSEQFKIDDFASRAARMNIEEINQWTRLLIKLSKHRGFPLKEELLKKLLEPNRIPNHCVEPPAKVEV